MLSRLISAGLKPVHNHTERLCLASYHRQSSKNLKIKIIKLVPVFLARHLTVHKSGFNLIVFNFNIRGKLSIIRFFSVLKERSASVIYEVIAGAVLRLYVNALIAYSSQPSFFILDSFASRTIRLCVLFSEMTMQSFRW